MLLIADQMNQFEPIAGTYGKEEVWNVNKNRGGNLKTIRKKFLSSLSRSPKTTIAIDFFQTQKES